MQFSTTPLALRMLLPVFAALLVSCTPEALSPEQDDPVARVNGEEIGQEQYEAAIAQTEQSLTLQGQDPTDPALQEQIQEHALDQLIATLLLRQEVQQADLQVGEEEVSAEYQRITEQGGGEEAVLAQLKEAGFSQEQFREDIAHNLLVQKYINEQIASQDTTITEEELHSTYAQLSAEQENLPPLEEIEAPLREQLAGQKEQELLSALIADLRANADIEVLR